MKKEYLRESFFQKKFNSDYKSIPVIDKIHWNKIFQQELRNFLIDKFNVPTDLDLKDTHRHIDKKYFKIQVGDTAANDRTIFNTSIFELSERIDDTYKDFLFWVRQNLIKQDFYFQKTPTIRVHMPGVDMLYPKWHSDSFLGHSPRNINIWLGLTDNKHSDFWAMDVAASKEWFKKYGYNKENFIADAEESDLDFDSHGFNNSFEVNEIFNSIFVFDSRCIHTALHRTEKDLTTRFSIDTRVLPTKDYKWIIIDNKPVFVGTGVKKAEFRPGHPYGYADKTIEEALREQNEV